jgi:hypothetical protein
VQERLDRLLPPVLIVWLGTYNAVCTLSSDCALPWSPATAVQVPLPALPGGRPALG